MPTYDYRCEACGHELEVFQSMTEAAKRKCPACGKLKLVRLIGTGGGILFKGTGFYQTDYRSDSYKKAEKAERETSSGSGSKGDSGGSSSTPPSTGGSGEGKGKGKAEGSGSGGSSGAGKKPS